MYEVEIKVELQRSQFLNFQAVFRDQGLYTSGVAVQSDFYVKAKKSLCGGPQAYDIERYRVEDSQEGDPKITYTQKTWQVAQGQLVRQETERETDKETLVHAREKYPQTLTILKTRVTYRDRCLNRDVNVSLDSVKFDHCQNCRYFMEAEILVEVEAEVPVAESVVIHYVARLLRVDDDAVVKAPSMFTMAFEKL